MGGAKWTARRSSYTAEELSKFQFRIDGLFRLWVRQYGRNGCTTYIHNLTAGHILYFMREYGYFSKYSQQSHEAANAMMTSFSFYRTQLGGFVSVSQEISKLKPLVHGFQRRLMWLCGIGHKVFDKNYDQYIEGFVSQGEEYSSGSDGDINDSSDSSNGGGEYSEDEEDAHQDDSIAFDADFGCDSPAALWL
jgi:hypothetical protein